MNLVRELSAGSAEFGARWKAHNIVSYLEGTKRFLHPEAGPLTLAYRSMKIPVSARESLPMCVYTPEPGSPSEERLRLLASLTAPARSPAAPGIA